MPMRHLVVWVLTLSAISQAQVAQETISPAASPFQMRLERAATAMGFSCQQYNQQRGLNVPAVMKTWQKQGVLKPWTDFTDQGYRYVMFEIHPKNQAPAFYLAVRSHKGQWTINSCNGRKVIP